MPVAGRDLRQQAENGVSEVTVAGNQRPSTAGEETVRLCVVEFVAHDRQRKRLELVGIHLVVARHHRGRVDALGERALVPRDDRSADTTVLLVHDHLDARVVDRPRTLGRRRPVDASSTTKTRSTKPYLAHSV